MVPAARRCRRRVASASEEDVEHHGSIHRCSVPQRTKLDFGGEVGRGNRYWNIFFFVLLSDQGFAEVLLGETLTKLVSSVRGAGTSNQ